MQSPFISATTRNPRAVIGSINNGQNGPISVRSFGYSYIPGGSLSSVQQPAPVSTFGTAHSPTAPSNLYPPTGAGYPLSPTRPTGGVPISVTGSGLPTNTVTPISARTAPGILSTLFR